ncbi:FAD-binding oxidoreductase [Rheinheimera tilapiae]|uniref:FAD-dependent oxidoreductase n=1 Tax=Rheinheimera tilapiae TaxID=875043 RepID=A0ABV6BBH0_9GAMM
MNNDPQSATLALMKWRQLLGDEYVITDSEPLKLASTATFATSAAVTAIVKPARDQVAAVVAIAAEFNIALYTISSGKNWGYGSRVPSIQHAVLLDLGRLNEISGYDPEHHLITVGAGVTQRQLADFLLAQGGMDWMDCTGSHPDCSIVGNTVERGFGHTPYGEHANFIGAMEVLLADGRIIKTGFGRFDGAKASGMYKWGLGPALDQLFLQSNLGIVLSMTIWLMPKPEKFVAFYLSASNETALEQIVQALVPLKRSGVITSLPHIANAYRVLGGMQQYPWPFVEKRSVQFPLPGDITEQLKKQWQVGTWNLSGALYGTKEQVANAKKQVRKSLRRVKGARLNFISDELLRFIEIFQKPIAFVTRMDLPGMLKVLRPVQNMMKGQPSAQFLTSSYWRMKTVPNGRFDMDKDNVGLIWSAFVAPADAKNARQLMDIVDTVLPEFGFEPAVTLTLLNERCIDAVVSISFDRTASAPDGQRWDELALQCRDKLYQSMFSCGFYPYRTDVSKMAEMVHCGDPQYLQVLADLKHALDPHGILAPGRYIASASEKFTSQVSI